MRLRINAILLATELKSITRDKMLLFISFLPLLLSVLLRFAVPAINRLLIQELNFDLSPYYGLIVSFLIAMTPMLLGWVIGFILLDNRDEHVLQAIAVTPLGKSGYLSYHIAFSVIVSLIMAPLQALITGLVHFRLLPVIGTGFCSALSASIYALLLAALAKNKVEGMAIGKLLGLGLIAPFIVYLIESPWQIAAGLLPSYWPARMYQAMESGNALGYGLTFAAGLILQGGLIVCLWRVYLKRTE